MSGPWTGVEVGLVLQGGGALGAYEWGAIEVLFDLMDQIEASGMPVVLKAVTGVSIGAINGACIVGAKDRRDGLERLGKLWGELQLESPFPGRLDLSKYGLPSIAPGRDLSLLGLPGFYHPRPDVWNLLRWTSFYDTSPLEDTLCEYVAFEEIDRSATTFVVTAVDVESGVLKRFRNKPLTPAALARRTAKQQSEERDEPVSFKPHHIRASGSLAPQFPWTVIKERLYWDGGIVDNTPLGDAMEAFSDDERVFRLIVVMNLYPLAGCRPANLLEVSDRVHELSYGNRLRQDRAGAKRINKLTRTIELLARALRDAQVPLSAELAKCIAEAGQYKIAKVVDIDFQAPGGGDNDDSAGLRDFSPKTIEKRRCAGRIQARTELTPVLVEEGLLIPQPESQAAARMET